MDYPAKAIVDLAHERVVDLIVMATHGRTGLDRLAHGSVAGHVLHHASTPVLILHGQDCVPPVLDAAVIGTAPIAHPAPEWLAPAALAAREVDGGG